MGFTRANKPLMPDIPAILVNITQVLSLITSSQSTLSSAVN